MTLITVSDEQARLISSAESPIMLVDPRGQAVGKVAPMFVDSPGPDASEEEIVADIKRRMATHDGTFRLYPDLLKDLRERFPE